MIICNFRSVIYRIQLMYQSKYICNFVFKYYTVFIYFCDFIFSSLKHSGWDQGIGFISILIILFCSFCDYW